MARRPNTSGYDSFDAIQRRLDEIDAEMKRKDLPLESSLDLYDEAIALVAKAVDFVDTDEPSASEVASAEEHATEEPTEGADGA